MILWLFHAHDSSESEFLDFQSYGFKVLLMEVHKKASRCTVESSRQPGYIKELIEGYRQQDAKNKKPGKQEQTSSLTRSVLGSFLSKWALLAALMAMSHPRRRGSLMSYQTSLPKAKSSCKKTKVALSEMKTMKTKKPSVMKKA